MATFDSLLHILIVVWFFSWLRGQDLFAIWFLSRFTDRKKSFSRWILFETEKSTFFFSLPSQVLFAHSQNRQISSGNEKVNFPSVSFFHAERGKFYCLKSENSEMGANEDYFSRFFFNLEKEEKNSSYLVQISCFICGKNKIRALFLLGVFAKALNVSILSINSSLQRIL